MVGPRVYCTIARLALPDTEQLGSDTEPTPVVQFQLELELLVAGHFPPCPLFVLDELRLGLLRVEVASDGERGVDRVKTGVDGGLMLAHSGCSVAFLEVVAHDAPASYADALETERPARVRLDPFTDVSSCRASGSSQAVFCMVLVHASPVQPADGAKSIGVLRVDAEREPSTRRRVEKAPFLICLPVSFLTSDYAAYATDPQPEKPVRTWRHSCLPALTSHPDLDVDLVDDENAPSVGDFADGSVRGHKGAVRSWPSGRILKLSDQSLRPLLSAHAVAKASSRLRFECCSR